MSHLPFLKLYRGTHNRIYSVRIQDENESNRNITGQEVRLRVFSLLGNVLRYDKILTTVTANVGLCSLTPKYDELPDAGLYRGTIAIQNGGAGLVPISALTYNEPYDTFPVIIEDSLEQDVPYTARVFDGVTIPP